MSDNVPTTSSLSQAQGQDTERDVKSSSAASDPPLTLSPLSPPIGGEIQIEEEKMEIGEDPGFSPIPDDQEPSKKPLSIDEELSKNPYVMQALDALPSGPSIDESQLPPATSEEQKRRRELRERVRREMDEEIERALGLQTPPTAS